jgi:hypothetical protein
MLADKHIRACAYVVGQELARRRRSGIPVPATLTELHAALNRELSGTGHETCENTAAPEQFETAAQRAERLGVTERTVRRRAARNGHQPIAGRYLFVREKKENTP